LIKVNLIYMKLTKVSLILLVLLAAGILYVAIEALGVQRENSAKMAKITQYIDALAMQQAAQEKVKTDSGVEGALSPVNFNSAGAADAQIPAGIPPVPSQAAADVLALQNLAPQLPAGAESAPPTAAVAPPPVVAAAAPVVDTPLQRLVRGAEKLGEAMTVSVDQGLVTLNVGAKQGVKSGQEFMMRRGNSVVAKLKITLVEDGEAAAEFVPKSIPAGIQPQVGDEIIPSVKLPQ
jgi:hypothetical protein